MHKRDDRGGIEQDDPELKKCRENASASIVDQPPLGGQSFSELLVLRRAADVDALKAGRFTVGADLGGGGIQGVQVGRATSSIASIGGGDRPLARGGAGLSRTDEEIQIVFYRYKASFYRLYNRELRNDPTLRGQMVLRLTIQPDGSVSMCVLQSSDMNAPELAAQVVNRVLTINFGAKDGVQALTIVYPIDFLPAGEADS